MWLTTTDTNNLFDPFYDEFWSDKQDKQIESFSPAANVIEKKDGYELDVILPGMKKQDITIDVKDNILTISGERINEHKEEKDGYYRYESAFGKFTRSWNTDGVSADKISADYKDGVLTVLLPKKTATKSKQVKIA